MEVAHKGEEIRKFVFPIVQHLAVMYVHEIEKRLPSVCTLQDVRSNLKREL